MNKVNKVLIVGLFIIVGILCGLVIYFNYKANNIAKEVVDNIESIDTHSQYYYQSEFEVLKKKNKELYDSLKNQKKQIESLSQFKYKKIYITDTIYTNPETPIPEEIKQLPDSTYIYESETDTLSYTLEVNSKVEPNWYKLKTEINDEFTIVNKQYDNGLMTTTIKSENGGEIYDVTNWQKGKTKKWYNNFSFGPSVSVGYDPINRNVGVVVGVGVTYNILGK